MKYYATNVNIISLAENPNEAFANAQKALEMAVEYGHAEDIEYHATNEVQHKWIMKY